MADEQQVTKPAFEIDFEALNAEVDKLSPEELKEKLVTLRARQKVATKKYYSSENARKYAARIRERNKIMAAAAEKLGLTEEIDKLADERAAEELAGSQPAAE